MSITFSYHAVAESIPDVTENRRTRILKLIDCPKPTDGRRLQLTAGEALLFWLGQLLVKLAPVPEEQQLSILEEFHGGIIDFGNKLGISLEDGKSSIQSALLVFLDRRWAAMSGRGDFLDLKEGVFVKLMPRAHLEAITFDLTTLFAINRSKIEQKTLRVQYKPGVDNAEGSAPLDY